MFYVGFQIWLVQFNEIIGQTCVDDYVDGDCDLMTWGHKHLGFVKI